MYEKILKSVYYFNDPIPDRFKKYTKEMLHNRLLPALSAPNDVGFVIWTMAQKPRTSQRAIHEFAVANLDPHHPRRAVD
jgi:hypothetical protein